MPERTLHIVITTEPLHRAIKQGLPAIEMSVDLSETTGSMLEGMLEEARRRLEVPVEAT